MERLFIVAVLKKDIVKRKFLVRADDFNVAIGNIEAVNKHEMAAGEPLYSADSKLSAALVEFDNNVMEI